MYDSEDEATLDADRVIAEDSELAEFEGMSTVTVTVALDPDAKVTETIFVPESYAIELIPIPLLLWIGKSVGSTSLIPKVFLTICSWFDPNSNLRSTSVFSTPV